MKGKRREYVKKVKIRRPQSVVNVIHSTASQHIIAGLEPCGSIRSACIIEVVNYKATSE